MNNNLVVSKDEAWAIRPYGPDVPVGRGQRVYSAINLLDLSTLIRNPGALALAGAWRDRVRNHHGNPGDLAFEPALSRDGIAGGRSAVGVDLRPAGSRTPGTGFRHLRHGRDPDRAAREPQRRRAHGAGPQPRQQSRCRQPRSAGVRPPADGDRFRGDGAEGHCARGGPADQVQFRLRVARSSRRPSPTGLPTISSIRPSSGATNRRPMRAISSSGRSTRPAATSSDPSGDWSLMRRSRGSSARSGPAAAKASRQAAMPARCRAIRCSRSTRPWPTATARRVAGGRRLPQLAVHRADIRRHGQHRPPCARNARA